MDHNALPDTIEHEPAEPLYYEYRKLKQQFPEVVILFDLGRSYNTFDADAVIVGQVCQTRVFPVRWRSGGNLTGFPSRHVIRHVKALIQAGRKVAIVEPCPPKAMTRPES